MKKLRLLMTKECPRNCQGCCNKDWDLNNLPICHDFSPYDQILVTGGEPLYRPAKLFPLLNTINLQKKPDADLFVYTAWLKDIEIAKVVLKTVDGITVTLHDQNDVKEWKEFAEWCHLMGAYEYRSLRLNVFEGIDYKDQWNEWDVKDKMKWIKNCPLPDGEVFMRIDNI